MDVVWIVIGVLLLLMTLLDAFLAVLNYDEAGLFVDRIVRAQWIVLRAFTRRVGRRWRPLVLRQATGIIVVVTILWWVAGIVFGFALVYFGALGMTGAIVTSTGVEPDFWGALYLSLGQFSTVGVDNIGPGAALMNLLTVAEAMISVVMLSFIITFLGSVYGVIQSLQSLSANFFRAGLGITDPIDSLAPFFPDGRSRGLDGQLDSILGSLSAYGHGLSQNRAAYYFQSGRDQFSLPFSLFMTSGVIGALRWGLPTRSDPASEPGLTRLIEAYEDFRVRLQQALRLATGPVPAPVTAREFASAVAAYEQSGSQVALDPWAMRFLRIDRRMAALTRASDAIDVDDAYRRYTAWLPFEFRAQALLAAVSRDLDYQPIYRRIAATPDGIPIDAPDGGYELLPMDVDIADRARADPLPRHPRAGGSWLRRRGLFIDPGLLRLAAAGRTLTGVVAAMAIVGALSFMQGSNALYGTVLAGLIALFASPDAFGSPPGGRPWVGLLAVVPAMAGITLGTVLPREALVTGIAIALVAAVAVWLRRFGARMAGLGQLAFIAYYFSLMLGLELVELLDALAAGGVGVLCGWAAGLIPRPSPSRRVDAGIAALHERVVYLLETSIDLVSSAREDGRLIRTLRRQQAAVQRTAAAIAGSLDETGAATRAPAQARALRVRVFGLRLAVDNLVSLVPATGMIAITIEQRARLAADLVAAQAHLVEDAVPASRAALDAPPSAADHDAPLGARRIRAAILELRSAVDQLDAARGSFARSSAHGDGIGRETTDADLAARADSDPAQGEAPGAARDSSRQAVQAGLSTGLALLLGSLVSTSYQYWAAMPAFSVLSGSDGETRLKAFQRILATVLGAAVGFGLAILAGHSPAVALPLLVVSVFFIAFLRPVSSVWVTFWQTLLLATVYDVLGTLNVETLQVRVAETAIGALVAVVVSALVLPTRTRARVLAAMSDVVRQCQAIAHDALRPAPGNGAFDDDLREVARRLTALEDAARPIRSNPGSMRRAGIEAQLTALWSMVYDVRRVAADRATGAGITAGVARRLDAATADAFAAAEAVLAGALPRRIPATDELDASADADTTEAGRALVLHVTRLNQALLALIEALRPGTVAAADPSIMRSA
ncbi:FUSC family protein [Microbacterium sp. CPCC 204701]|uniref:FUSC family protein n=1 Tax=Microbacterium sp. CPCC 204701 TaxID=2493084 RepID=UPI000FDAFC46|nr:FUSC family protein [Microbacterium sp. CPCC 204701]